MSHISARFGVWEWLQITILPQVLYLCSFRCLVPDLAFDSALRFVLSTSHYCVHSKKKRGYENSLNYSKRYISLPNWAGCSSVVTAPCGYIYFFVVVFLQEFNKTDEIQIRDLHRFGPVNQTTLAFFSSVINAWPTSNFLKLNKSFCWL